MKFSRLTKSPAQTKRLGENFAKNILKIKSLRGAAVLGLKGDLGGGKTTFLQGFARGLGIKAQVLSPTFVIMRKFQIPKPKGKIAKFKNFYHIDCYRVQKPKELSGLGFKEIAANSGNIMAIEWAEKIKKILSKNVLWLEFQFIDKSTRKITIIQQNAKNYKKTSNH